MCRSLCTARRATFSPNWINPTYANENHSHAHLRSLCAIDIIRGVDIPIGQRKRLPKRRAWFLGCIFYEQLNVKTVDIICQTQVDQGLMFVIEPTPIDSIVPTGDSIADVLLYGILVNGITSLSTTINQNIDRLIGNTSKLTLIGILIPL